MDNLAVGWIGLVLIVACALLSSYTGSILGQAWLIVQERFPEYKKSCPDPYPVLGEKTFGKKGRYERYIYRECYLCHEREKMDSVLLGYQKVTTYNL